MKIRPACPADLPMLRAILAENAGMLDGVDYSHFSPPCLVGEIDGAVVGFIQATLGQPYAIITELSIAREHHRKGYGMRLLEHMETVLRCAGVTAWTTYTGEKNDHVIKIAERLGRCTGRGYAFVRVL